MGQKINPVSLRMGITKKWPARWFLKRGLAPRFLEEDEIIRRTIMKKIGQAGISAIEIERTSTRTQITIKAAKPGFVIGRGGKGIEELAKLLQSGISEKRKGKKEPSLGINVEELKRSEISASYTAQQIAWDIERRIPFRRLLKKYLEQIMQNKEAEGAKILVSGRLDGAEIARREWLKKGRLPLQTLRADLDYGQATAFTTYGTVGVKVWINKGTAGKKENK